MIHDRFLLAIVRALGADYSACRPPTRAVRA